MLGLQKFEEFTGKLPESDNDQQLTVARDALVQEQREAIQTSKHIVIPNS